MTQDVKTQVVEKVKSSPVFAIQCDETTDVAQCSQLLVYTRFLWKESKEEDVLFCCPRETITTAVDSLNAVSNFCFQEHDISWENLFDVCADGAPFMLGSRLGFISKVKEKSPSAISTQCFISPSFGTKDSTFTTPEIYEHHNQDRELHKDQCPQYKTVCTAWSLFRNRGNDTAFSR